jgi:hypothetical protein
MANETVLSALAAAWSSTANEQPPPVPEAPEARQSICAPSPATPGKRSRPGLWKFQEAGGSWPLADIVAAFEAAADGFPAADLRRTDEPDVRCGLENPKLAAELLERGLGQLIGGASHRRHIRFLTAVVQEAARILQSAKGD